MSFRQYLVASTIAAVVAAAPPPIRFLAPENDINLPPGKNALEPLKWAGANSPWFAGEDIYGISSEVPEGCVVDMASYNLRHGSRFPDPGAYAGWVDMYERFQNASMRGTGDLSFIKDWAPVLTDPVNQIANESPTGWKEAFDMGYTLRTRYPQLYRDGETMYVWANKYNRVVQTAQNFLHGYLGSNATLFGAVVTVDRKHPAGTGSSLSPSDMCPNFEDTSGTAERAVWAARFVPAAKARLMAMLELDAGEDFVFTDNDVTQVPYLCGFESQITGRLSPWCDVMTDDELRDYEYWNDLRYFYGVGPGTDLPSKMMTPYLSALVGLLAAGPGRDGVAKDGSAFALPGLLMAFMNDGQINELVTASGVFDHQEMLDPAVRDDGRLFMASRFSTQRGTIAFERLACDKDVAGGGGSGNSSHKSKKSRAENPPRAVESDNVYVRIRLNDAVYVVPSCRSGPGESCPLAEYVQYLADKLEAEGDWMANCNVTDPEAPSTAEGAKFFTDFSGEHVDFVEP